MTKILINTITREDVINRSETAEKTGTKGEQAFAATLSCPEISNVVFPLGEWRHLDETWVAKNAVELAKYPDLKEPHVILEERLKKQIEEQGLTSFAEGIRQAAVLYGTALPEIADTVLKIVPMKIEAV